LITAAPLTETNPKFPGFALLSERKKFAGWTFGLCGASPQVQGFEGEGRLEVRRSAFRAETLKFCNAA